MGDWRILIVEWAGEQAMRVLIFEDEQAEQFGPIALLRPVCELLCGHFSVRERVLRSLPVTAWGVRCREYLEESYREQHPEAHVNDETWLSEGPTLLINSRWLCDPQVLTALGRNHGNDLDTVGIIDGEVAWMVLDPLELPVLMSQSIGDALASIARTRLRTVAPGVLAKFPWDLIQHNGTQITHDHRTRSVAAPCNLPEQSGVVGPVENLIIDPTAEVDPFVVFDVRHGPIFIDAKAKIQAFTRIEGPCYVGRESQLFRTNLREGTSIGPVCRVGGEVEESILQGFVNKYHDGFLGHAFVSPWCNLGALTTNSDLKNDYSAVSVPLMGESIKTGQMKVGCFFGDHTKTAIGSVFNTGSSVGVMCQVLPAGELLPKHIPSFTRIWHGELVDGFPLDACLETARAAMQRRGVDLTEPQERLLRHVFQMTQTERQRAFTRHQTLSTKSQTTKSQPAAAITPTPTPVPAP